VLVKILFSCSLFFNAVVFIPQAIKIFRLKNSGALSLPTFVGFNIMQLLATLHGYFEKDYVLMSGFLSSLITCGTVTILIMIYRKQNHIKKTR
jgi:MtN3 and saliva related transmembrane protein